MFIDYRNNLEEEFFECKRINDIKTWQDIKFIDNKILENLGLTRKASSEKLSSEELKQLKKILIFNTQNTKVTHLREHAAIQEKRQGTKKALSKGLVSGQIIPFEKLEIKPGINFISKAKEIDVPTFSSLYEYLARGEHIGACGFTSKIFGIYYHDIFKNIECHEGALPIIEGSKKSINGNHAWIEADYNGKRYIIDTSLLVAIPIELKEAIGYKTHGNSEKLIEKLTYINQTSNPLTVEDESLIDCMNSLSNNNKGKMSYRTFLKYSNRIKDYVER